MFILMSSTFCLTVSILILLRKKENQWSNELLKYQWSIELSYIYSSYSNKILAIKATSPLRKDVCKVCLLWHYRKLQILCFPPNLYILSLWTILDVFVRAWFNTCKSASHMLHQKIAPSIPLLLWKYQISWFMEDNHWENKFLYQEADIITFSIITV